MTYSEKLKDPRWQKKRLEILNRDGWKCQECSGKDSELNVHHRSYHPGLDPWDYPVAELVTLCRSCHEIRTSLDERMTALLGTVSGGAIAVFVALLESIKKEEVANGSHLPKVPNVELLTQFFVHSCQSTWSSFYSPSYILSSVDLLRSRLDAVGLEQTRKENKP